MAKAKIGLYSVKGDQLTRTHRACPKCGPGTFLAEHNNRRSCGKCGYAESRTGPAPPKDAAPAGRPKPAKAAPAAPAPPAKAA